MSAELPSIFSTHNLHRRAMELLTPAARVQVASEPSRNAILSEGRFAEVIIVRAPLPPQLFEAADRLRAVIRHGAGLDMIPVEEATRAGVLVANVPAVNASSVAEYVIFAAIALLRRFRLVDRDLRTGGWNAGRAHADLGFELTGRRLGIVGMGNVGRAVHHIARGGFGLDVCAYTPRRETLPPDVAFVDLDTLAAASDIVVLCCPLTPETVGLLSRQRIARMKSGALLINVSRGPVVDEPALIEALQAGRIAGAALDVFTDQPLDPRSPLFAFNNILLTPHMAGITDESMQRMGEGAALEALRVLAGKLPVNLCNPAAVERYRQRFAAR